MNNVLDLVMSNVPDWFGKTECEINTNFSDHNFVQCELLLDLLCNTKKLCSDNIYTTIVPKLKWNGATSELWDSYLDTLNLDNWCELVNEDSSIDLKVNILIQKIEEAAHDVFE